MKVQIIQNTTAVLDELRNELSSSTSEYYMLIPAEGKALKNINTGIISIGAVYVPTLKSKYIYEEIEVPEAHK